MEDLLLDTYDIVIDATGVIPVMNRAIDFARKGGTVLLFGVPPSGKNMEVEGFKIFQKGLTVLSSFTSVRNSFQAVDLLQSGQIRVELADLAPASIKGNAACPGDDREPRSRRSKR